MLLDYNSYDPKNESENEGEEDERVVYEYSNYNETFNIKVIRKLSEKVLPNFIENYNRDEKSIKEKIHEIYEIKKNDIDNIIDTITDEYYIEKHPTIDIMQIKITDTDLFENIIHLISSSHFHCSEVWGEELVFRMVLKIIDTISPIFANVLHGKKLLLFPDIFNEYNGLKVWNNNTWSQITPDSSKEEIKMLITRIMKYHDEQNVLIKNFYVLKYTFFLTDELKKQDNSLTNSFHLLYIKDNFEREMDYLSTVQAINTYISQMLSDCTYIIHKLIPNSSSNIYDNTLYNEYLKTILKHKHDKIYIYIEDIIGMIKFYTKNNEHTYLMGKTHFEYKKIEKDLEPLFSEKIAITFIPSYRHICINYSLHIRLWFYSPRFLFDLPYNTIQNMYTILDDPNQSSVGYNKLSNLIEKYNMYYIVSFHDETVDEDNKSINVKLKYCFLTKNFNYVIEMFKNSNVLLGHIMSKTNNSYY